MNYRQGYVVETHPNDNAVDLVMADNGERLIGVKVMSGDGSARTGGINLPDVPARKNKWDISERTDQDMTAAVGYIGRQPIVSGFIYPPQNQMVTKDKRTMFRRHQSDVQWSIDGLGNIQLKHPGGAYIRIGEQPDAAQVETAQASADDRNTGRKVNVRIGLAGNVVVLTMTPEGAVTFKLDKDFSIEASGNANITCKQATVTAPDGITLDTPVVSVPNGDVVANGISLVNHITTGVQPGSGTSNVPR